MMLVWSSRSMSMTELKIVWHLAFSAWHSRVLRGGSMVLCVPPVSTPCVTAWRPLRSVLNSAQF